MFVIYSNVLGQLEKEQIKKIRETIKRNYQHKGKSAKIYMRIEFYQIAIAKKL